MTTQQQYEILRNELNEQQWRVFLGTEALKIGYGGISLVAKLSGADWKTVQRGVKELKGERARVQGRIRQVGGGKEEGDRDGSGLAPGPGGVTRAQGGSDEPDQMDDALIDPPSQCARPAGASHQEDGAGRGAPRAGLFAQGQQENAGRCFSCRPRSAVWAYHDPV